MPANIEKRKKRHKRQAVLGAAVFELLMLVPLLILFAFFRMTPEAAAGLRALLGIAFLICLLPMGIALVVLVQRFKEIEGGELDAAAEY